ncbi:hypothetical protein BAUCODRAFT_122825 [Baudoinia panamericana UAMH 10762]|uniref:rRNA-processing protein FYV7 n=1 Tax=Baudoinia panamericana (strain UAMH 10762) TaxID=717646 RepID=M2MJJ6_BAUPA|nr:uncharacterized protein BAUCODRAFT_122825 [Baudoinia panamericana UAMH 10762]EMC96866.1 hypothetical protein BAUCODRAFT_122825 [Baudoinia panamericana UAMH 10762]
MAEKRKREDGANVPDYRPGKKKQKRGFITGPANLPDGPYKRKTQKLKDTLIKQAKIKKDYAKVKKRTDEHDSATTKDHQEQVARHEPSSSEAGPEPSTAPHPDRQTLIDRQQTAPNLDSAEVGDASADYPARRERRPRHQPFKLEHEQALRRKAEAEERRKAREEALRQRQTKLEERERFRRAMAKARSGGPNGQRKLGRESKVLLEKVKRMVTGGG